MPELKQDSPTPRSPEVTAGILKQKEKKELENAIRGELIKLGSTFTKKDINSFLSLVETSKDIGELRKELEKNVDSKDKKEAIASILQLADQIRSGALERIRALEGEMLKEKVEAGEISEAQLKQFYSHGFEFVKKLEDAKLGKNIITDGIGIGVGVLDSVVIILKILLDLVIDAGKLLMSPKKAINEYRETFSNK